jgi:hypothetical protein
MLQNQCPFFPSNGRAAAVKRKRSGKKTLRANLGILRDFFQYPANKLVPFGINVSTNLDPLKFPNLPVAPTVIKTLADDLAAKQAAIITGGSVEYAARNNAFDALTAALDKDADAVEMVVGMNMEMLLGTGYLPASTNHASSPLDDTAIISLLNNGTTQALLRLQTVTNAKTYQVQISADNGKTWQEAVISTKAIRIVIPNLVSGTTYLVRARAIGGSTGASGWTGPGSIMST